MLDLVTVWSDRIQGSLECWEMEKEECELFVKQSQQLIRRALKIFSLLQRMLSFKLESCGLPSAYPVLCSTLFVLFMGIKDLILSIAEHLENLW